MDVRKRGWSDGRLRATIVQVEGKVRISGESGLSVAWAFHHYLKYYCHSHISWETSQLSLASPLPAVNTSLTSQDQYRSVE